MLVDFRVVGRTLHKLDDIVMIVFLGVILDCNDYEEMEDLALQNIEGFRKNFGLSLLNGVPDSTTLERVFRRLDPVNLRAYLQSRLDVFAKLKDKSAVNVIDIDGKEMRGTRENGSKHAQINMVSAWLEEDWVCFGEVKTDAKSNEIKAIPELLDLINVENSIVRIDAIACQEEITKKIISKKGDFIISLKANQKTLHEQVADWFVNFKRHFDVYETVDGDHGRIETRRLYVCNQVELLEETARFGGIKSLFMLETTRVTNRKTTQNVRYYISSLENPTAQRALELVRERWGVENHLHWHLDVTLKEDQNRTRKQNGPQNLNVMRKMAITILKSAVVTLTDGKKSKNVTALKRKRKAMRYDLRILKDNLNLEMKEI